MSSAAGTRLGHYQVRELLGAGGMGEVYRARDTELGREVAIKVLPESFAENAERLARFDREAHLLASLNHPNIATLFAFAAEGPTRFLVMELVEGETLAERVGRGPIPVEETLPLFLQIAEGLEAAHEKGVIHRDLKPANIKVSEEGRVKILDFGLAKAMAPDPEPEVLSHSPTLTAPATRRGEILGTAAYMSPEQAMGRAVDKRADIWAFGCCLYEALSGERPFRGEAVSDTLASVLKEEPEWGSLPGEVPLEVRELLSRCLEKQARERLRDIGDARIELRQALTAPSARREAAAVLPRRRRRWGTLTSLGLAVAAALLTGLVVWRVARPEPEPRPSLRVDLRLPETDVLNTQWGSALSISPDGRTVVYAALRGSVEMLHRRSLEESQATPIAGTEDGTRPFFSPDGRWIGFAVQPDFRLMKVSLQGGQPEPLLTSSQLEPVRPVAGVEWAPDDTVLAGSLKGGLWRIPLDGGAAQPLTTPDAPSGERFHFAPRLLTSGREVLFSVLQSEESLRYRFAVLSLESGQWRLLGDGAAIGQARSGHIVFTREGTLWALPFDGERLVETGAAVPVLEGALGEQSVLARSGTLVYAAGQGASQSRLVWVDREGRTTSITEQRGRYGMPRVSPDGRRLAFGEAVGEWTALWVHDLARGTRLRLTEDSSVDPLWTPDGERITFGHGAGMSVDVYWMPADGSGTPELLLEGEDSIFPSSWSGDGRTLACAVRSEQTQGDLWVLSLDGEPAARPWLATPSVETQPVFSPDGRWLAYVSDESGRREVYVQAFPGPGRRWVISTDGGQNPLWSPDGDELFYLEGDAMMAVPVTTEPRFSPGSAVKLFEKSFVRARGGARMYDIHPDGQRFAMVQSDEEEPRHLNVILNWDEELERLAPGGRR